MSLGDALFSDSDYWAFRASVELVCLFRVCAGGSGSAAAGIRLLPIIVHPMGSFCDFSTYEYSKPIFDFYGFRASVWPVFRLWSRASDVVFGRNNCTKRVEPLFGFVQLFCARRCLRKTAPGSMAARKP